MRALPLLPLPTLTQGCLLKTKWIQPVGTRTRPPASRRITLMKPGAGARGEAGVGWTTRHAQGYASGQHASVCQALPAETTLLQLAVQDVGVSPGGKAAREGGEGPPSPVPFPPHPCPGSVPPWPSSLARSAWACPADETQDQEERVEGQEWGLVG